MTTTEFQGMLADLEVTYAPFDAGVERIRLDADHAKDGHSVAIGVCGLREGRWTQLAPMPSIPNTEAWNEWHLRRFFDTRGDAQRMTVRSACSGHSSEYIRPPQNIEGRVETIKDLEQVIQMVTDEWRLHCEYHAGQGDCSLLVCCVDAIDDPGDIRLRLLGHLGRARAELGWWSEANG